MAIVKRFFLIIGILGPLLFGAAALPVPAYACSCGETPSAQSALRDATAVFIGTVTNITVHDGRKAVDFQVHEQWKGNATSSITVTTRLHGAACGFPFEMGVKYLVYAYGDEDALRTGLCSRTAPTLRHLTIFSTI